MEAFLVALLPRFVASDIPWRPIGYGSKQQLLARLPQRLLGYARYDPAHRPKILVLVDRDDDDCAALKLALEAACRAAALSTKAVPNTDGRFDVVNRIVVEELEAWFFGDGAALQQGWPAPRATWDKRATAIRTPSAAARTKPCCACSRRRATCAGWIIFPRSTRPGRWAVS